MFLKQDFKYPNKEQIKKIKIYLQSHHPNKLINISFSLYFHACLLKAIMYSRIAMCCNRVASKYEQVNQ